MPSKVVSSKAGIGAGIGALVALSAGGAVVLSRWQPIIDSVEAFNNWVSPTVTVDTSPLQGETALFKVRGMTQSGLDAFVRGYYSAEQGLTVLSNVYPSKPFTSHSEQASATSIPNKAAQPLPIDASSAENRSVAHIERATSFRVSPAAKVGKENVLIVQPVAWERYIGSVKHRATDTITIPIEVEMSLVDGRVQPTKIDVLLHGPSFSLRFAQTLPLSDLVEKPFFDKIVADRL